MGHLTDSDHRSAMDKGLTEDRLFFDNRSLTMCFDFNHRKKYKSLGLMRAETVWNWSERMAETIEEIKNVKGYVRQQSC